MSETPPLTDDAVTTRPDDTLWVPGDPCASCGSRDTGWAVDTGAFCNGCGRCDADE